MTTRIISALLLFTFTTSLRADDVPRSPCDNVQGWRESICRFAKKNLVHSAWGYEHGLRDYTLALELAKAESVTVDEEVLFAAALLHDMGGFPAYEKAGVDHALRSTQVVDPILMAAEFPMAKSHAVKKAILTHSYYDSTVPETAEARMLHDADTLDFMGVMGITRLLSVTGREKGMNDVKSVVGILEKFQEILSGKLYGGTYTQKLGLERTRELTQFLQLLKVESYGFGIPAN